MVEKLVDKLYTYKAIVLGIVDGDTVKLQIDFGMRMYMIANCRLYSVNAPELHDKDQAVRDMANQSKKYLENKLSINSTVFVESKKLDKYGRPLVKIYYGENYLDLCSELLSLGLAIKYMD